MKFVINQLDTGDLNNFGVSLGNTGSVLRPEATGIFLTDNYLANQNYLRNYISLSSGSIVLTGQNINNQIYISGQNLSSGFLESGRLLVEKDTSLSGSFVQSGRDVRNLLTGLSGAFNQTGLNITNTLTGLSGAFNNTGLSLVQFLRALSGNSFHVALTGLSGAFNQTGLNVYKLITGLSGQFNQTGLNLYNLLSYKTGVFPTSGLTGVLNSDFAVLSGDLLELSGQFNQTGFNLTGYSNQISGSLNETGINLWEAATGLSGAFNITGLNLVKILTGISGSFMNEARSIKSGIALIRNNYLKINTFSGQIIVTGLDGVTISSDGQIINVSIASPETVGKVFDVNNLTGTPFVTGGGSLTSFLVDSGIYISGENFVPLIQSGNLGNVVDSGKLLWNNDFLWSGQLLNSINNSITGISSINSFFGNTTITGESLKVDSYSNNIVISKTGADISLSSLIRYKANYVTGKFDDDFDEPYLNPKWRRFGESTLTGSGITSSYFWAESKLSGLGFLLLQNVITGRDFEISAKLNFYRSLMTNNFQNIGIILRNSTSKSSFCFVSDLGDLNSTPSFMGAIYADEAYSSSIFQSGQAAGTFHNIDTHFKIKGRDKVYSFDYSEDGINWREMRMGYSNTLVVDQVGIIVASRVGGSNRCSAAFDWFRTTGLI